MNSLDRSHARPASAPHWITKALALVLLVLCLAIGLAGIILPIIPGLLFLAFALIIAARLCPPLGRRLRRSAAFAPYMERSDRFAALSLQHKFRLGLWLALKILWDSCVLVLHYTGRFIAWLLTDTPRQTRTR